MAQIASKAAAIQAHIQTLAITASKLTTQVPKGETSASAEHEAVRLSLLRTLRDLKNILEDPKDRSLQITLQVNQNVAIRAAIHLNIFEALSQHDVGDGVDIDLLTKGVGEQRADIVLVDIIIATGPNVKVVYSFDDMIPPLFDLPKYLTETQFRNPSDIHRGPFQHYHKTTLPYFDYVRRDPARLAVLNSAMQVQSYAFAESQSAVYPWEYELGQDVSDSEVVIVDVGGGKGQALEEIRKAHPGLKGRFVLQDLKGTVPEKVETAGIEIMEYDFFKPQPVKGARAYFFRRVLHDWPDVRCIEILRNTASALKPGYSRILIGDVVLPARNPPLLPSLFDFNMLTVAGMERTRKQWEELLEAAGLQIKKVWGNDGCILSIIEAVLKAESE
ncbi:o-methyltransferase [Rasamsonia emersonii CBS 393.64]|uniref:O-methyltransferase n=1 Tax=Rasamsonia emersonii (strain ATCC 16479 / CBS 393.64 / IMI 116815) TaxID=1408163 RepID=A0A0F4YZS6_RASE3|nr:o-methyltransferase [Rasamsonia emersonii CBS 393.64]KKA23341.1 o-methyltransferase [Rasamsonia emersonii CBS 393.64]